MRLLKLTKMSKIINTFCACIIFCSNILYSQVFTQKKQNSFSFSEDQKNFLIWKKSNDLKSQKGWKTYARFSEELKTYTDAKGDLSNMSEHANALIQLYQQKNAQQNLNSPNWLPFGPNAIPPAPGFYMTAGMGRINCIAFHPSNANTYFVGVAQGGVWKTSNNGSSWTPLTDNLPITRISDIEIDPTNPNTMYISLCDFEYIGFGLKLNGRKRNTHYGLGVYKTTDGGVTWNPTGLSFQLNQGDMSLIRKVLVNSTNSNVIIAAGTSGVFSSSNGGTTFTQINDSLIWDLIQDPNNPNTLYAAGGWVQNSNTGSAAIYKSTNFGLSWTVLNTGIPLTGTVQRIKLAMSQANSNVIYAACVDGYNGLYDIYKSVNAGVNWSNLNVGLNLLEWNDGSGTGGQGTYDLGFCVDKNDANKLFIGGVNLWGSSDGGTTWDPASHWTTSYGPSIHADIHFIAQQNSTGNYFVCHDGGIDRTSQIITSPWSVVNSGGLWPTVWSNITDGMQTTSFYRISSSKNSAGRVMAGAQDNSTFYFDGINWSVVIGGDGMDNAMDKFDNNNAIGSSQYGYFENTVDNGQSFSSISPQVTGGSAEWTTPIVADYNNNGVYYIGFSDVVKSIDNGNSWSGISSFPPDPNAWQDMELSSIAVSNSNPNAIVAARRVRYEYPAYGKVFVTQNNGTNWNDVTSGLPDTLYFTSVEFSESNSNEIYVGVGGFASGVKIFKSSNGGTTWQNISYNLPNLPLNCIKVVPAGNGAILAACDVGLYLLNPGSTTWVLQSVGLPNAIVSDIEFNSALNKVYVSTFGRGIWSADISSLVGEKELKPLSHNFSVYPNPSSGTLNIESSIKTNLENYIIKVVDVQGKLILEREINNDFKIQMNLMNEPGIYFISITGNSKTEVHRVLIQ